MRRAARTVAKAKRKKLRTLKSLKAEADKVFSIYIRQRGMDEGGTNTCCSCGALKHWKDLQCGHFVSRVYLSTRWLPLNCHPQCSACNVLRRGNAIGYAQFMLKAYGYDIFDNLIKRRNMKFKPDRYNYEYIIQRFKYFIDE
jgi:hypothetical protein